MATVFMDGFDSENRVDGFHSEDTAAGEPEQGRLSDAELEALREFYRSGGRSHIIRLIEEVRARREMDAQYRRARAAAVRVVALVYPLLRHIPRGSEVWNIRLRGAVEAMNDLTDCIEDGKEANSRSLSNDCSTVEEETTLCEETRQAARPAAIWEGRRRRRLELL